MLLLYIRFPNAIASEGISSGFETVHTSNAALLNRLGLAPLEIPDGHHKKRLAGPEPPGFGLQSRIHQPYSRRHGHRDSHVYIVKLPASPPYYTITKPHKTVKDDGVTKTGPNFPVGFQGNGKPAKIYHWNLPVVKKITEKKRLQSQLRTDLARKRLDDMRKRQQQASSVKAILSKLYPLDAASKSHDYYGIAGNNKLRPAQHKSGTKHVRNNDKRLSYPDDDDRPGDKVGFESRKASGGNDVVGGGGDKAYRLDDTSALHRVRLTDQFRDSSPNNPLLPKGKKHRKKAAMSYYAPIASKPGSTSIHKNFPGNGKPKAFYVMEKSRKPVYYHPLLP